MIRHRAASIDVAELDPPWDLTGERGPERFFQWDPWVRSYLLAQQLLEGLSFAVERPGSKPGVSATSVKLRVALPTSGASLDLASITRPSNAVFKAQVPEVLAWANLREERMPEVLAQIEAVYAFWGMLIPLQTDRLRATRELIEAAVQLAVAIEMRFKHELACWRPTDYSAQVQPMITTPGHGSLPSGHCTQAYVMAGILRALLNTQRSGKAYESINTQFERLCERISINRVVAGVHFPVDNVAGRLLGSVLGDYIVHRCGWTETGSPHRLSVGYFRGDKYVASDGFHPSRQLLYATNDRSEATFYEGTRRVDDTLEPAGEDSILVQLWRKALDEVKALDLAF